MMLEMNRRQETDMPTSALRFKGRRKRVFAVESTSVTRSKRANAQRHPSLTRSDLDAPPPSHPNMSKSTEDVVPIQPSIPPPDGPNQMANEDGLDQHDENPLMGHDDGADGITHPVEQNQTNEGVERREWERGPSMGHGLQKITRARRGKLPLVINEGRTRPAVPFIAAKFATECNITVRNNIPVLKHWKEYKKRPALVTLFMGWIQVSTCCQSSPPPLFCELVL